MLKLQAIGHLGKDAIVNQVNGKTVINFNVAHSEKYKDNQGTVINKTVWVACAYWSDKTAVAQYLLKGTLVYVEGTPDVKTYRDANGENKSNITLRVGSIQLLGSKPQEGSRDAHSAPSQNAPQTNYQTANVGDPLNDDDLPF